MNRCQGLDAGEDEEDAAYLQKNKRRVSGERGLGRQGQKADGWPILVAFFATRVGPLTGAGPGFHHTKKRVPRPCRVFCDRAGNLISLGQDGAEAEIPALSLQRAQGQGRGTRSNNS